MCFYIWSYILMYFCKFNIYLQFTVDFNMLDFFIKLILQSAVNYQYIFEYKCIVQPSLQAYILNEGWVICIFMCFLFSFLSSFMSCVNYVIKKNVFNMHINRCSSLISSISFNLIWEQVISWVTQKKAPTVGETEFSVEMKNH